AGAAHRLHELDPDRNLEILAAPWRRCGAREHVAEQILEAMEPAAGRAAAEDVLEALRVAAPATEAEARGARPAAARLLPAPELARLLGVEAGLQRVLAELVVELAPGLVAEDVVGVRDLLEGFLRRLVARVDVGVMLAGELAVRLLDLVRRRVLGDAEHGVQIAALARGPPGAAVAIASGHPSRPRAAP